jgi:AcrR family transcriptional regulator
VISEFSRARSADQRKQRRNRILDVATRMLTESRVGDLSLNELARQVGLAKSNLLRYYPSREAVLLAVYRRSYDEWLDAVESEFAGSARPKDVLEFAALLAATAAARPVLCELCANSTLVLEHNISGEVAADYKRAALGHAARVVALTTEVLGPLDGRRELLVAAGVNISLGGAWAMCRPSPGMIAAYRDDPELAVYRIDFEATMRELLGTFLLGVAAREG